MGYFYSEGFQRLGRIDDNGYIFDESAHRMGRIDFESGKIYSENLYYMGQIDKNGYMYDESFHRVGRIDENGYVYNEGQRRIGRIDEECVHKIFDKRSEGSGCFLTSACVEARSLADDCHELEILRSYRDTYLKNTPNGPREIEEYYQIAPKIVAAIHRDKHSASIFCSLYENLVQPCVKMIENKEYEGAHALYRKTVLQLQAQYQI